jgi:hypothetical protein
MGIDSNDQSIHHSGFFSFERTLFFNLPTKGTKEDLPETGISNLLPVNPESHLFFTKHNDNPVTIIWDRGEKISFNRCYLAWEINLNKIYQQKIPESATMRAYIDIFQKCSGCS